MSWMSMPAGVHIGQTHGMGDEVLRPVLVLLAVEGAGVGGGEAHQRNAARIEMRRHEGLGFGHANMASGCRSSRTGRAGTCRPEVPWRRAAVGP